MTTTFRIQASGIAIICLLAPWFLQASVVMPSDQASCAVIGERINDTFVINDVVSIDTTTTRDDCLATLASASVAIGDAQPLDVFEKSNLTNANTYQVAFTYYSSMGEDGPVAGINYYFEEATLFVQPVDAETTSTPPSVAPVTEPVTETPVSIEVESEDSTDSDSEAVVQSLRLRLVELLNTLLSLLRLQQAAS